MRCNFSKIILFNINDVLPAGEKFQEPALGLGYIKSYFDTHSYLKGKINIEILKNNIWSNLIKDDPDLIGISAVTQDYTNAIRYAERIKDSGSKAIIVIGGIHISNLPESFNNVFDIGVLGEGEETFKELTEYIYESGFNKEKLSHIKGLLYKEGEALTNTGKRELIENLDSIPSPYRKYLKESAFLHILTARGCPFRCAYCSSAAFWKYKVRFHSPERVVDEMLELIKDYKLKHISIWDDLFSINKERLREVVVLMRENGRFFNDVTFGVTARPNMVDEEICELLKQMNVTRVSLGIESGSDRILSTLNRGLTAEQNYKAISKLKEFGFMVYGGFIVGAPGETFDDLNRTYQFVLNSSLDGGGFGLAVPYPNTEFWHYARERNIVDNDMDFSSFVLINDPASIKSRNDLILLNRDINKNEFMELIVKIHRILIKKSTLSILNRKTLNFRNAIIILRNPLRFFPFIISILKRLVKSMFINV